ncbi:LytR C-terminal domain-containing protein, partial [Conexibacter sp. CPCC 205762]
RRGAAPAGRPSRPGARPQSAAPARAAAGGSRALPPEEEPPHGRRRMTAVLLALVALVVVAGAVWFVAIRDTGSDTPATRVETPEGGARRRAATRRTQTQRQQTPAPAHDSISVAVLNGTGLTGLAGRVMANLTAAGYPQGGIVADAGTTTASATMVNYRDGREAAAREVARTLGLPADATEVMEPATDQACAANSGGTCTADVVVVVGTDLQ